VISLKRQSTRTLHDGRNLPAPLKVRLFWIALFILHLSAIISLVSSQFEAWNPAKTGEIVRVVALSLSAGLFLLKVMDVRCLRLRPGRRSLIHVGVIDRAITGDHEIDPACLTIVCVVGTLSNSEHVRQLLAAASSIVAPSGQPAWTLPPVRFDRLRDTILKPHERFLVPAYAGPRAPPTC
jgi:hypothetical protein